MPKTTTDTDVVCPVCKTVQDEIGAFVSYWGDEGPKETECDCCGESLVVSEEVVRTFTVSVKSRRDA